MVLDPGAHPKLAGATYPLGIGQLFENHAAKACFSVLGGGFQWLVLVSASS
jgi:hypothetical protein